MNLDFDSFVFDETLKYSGCEDGIARGYTSWTYTIWL
jgi:hypothetical protein